MAPVESPCGSCVVISMGAAFVAFVTFSLKGVQTSWLGFGCAVEVCSGGWPVVGSGCV